MDVSDIPSICQYIWKSIIYLLLVEGVGSPSVNQPDINDSLILHYHQSPILFIKLKCNYHLVIYHSHGKSPFLIGKPPINGPFSMAMLNNQRVYIVSIPFHILSRDFFLETYWRCLHISEMDICVRSLI